MNTKWILNDGSICFLHFWCKSIESPPYGPEINILGATALVGLVGTGPCPSKPPYRLTKPPDTDKGGNVAQELHQLCSSYRVCYLFVWPVKLKWFEGVSKTLRKTLGGPVHFVPYLYGGRSPPYTYNTKYTSPLRFFDTPSIHSNLLEMLQNCPQN